MSPLACVFDKMVSTCKIQFYEVCLIRVEMVYYNWHVSQQIII